MGVTFFVQLSLGVVVDCHVFCGDCRKHVFGEYVLEEGNGVGDDCVARILRSGRKAALTCAL
jgi:hypothetical protein